MRPRAPIPADLTALALRQGGVLVRPQILASGFCDSQIDRLVRQENLQRLDRGVFLLGAGEPQWASYAWAGVLVGGRGSRLIGTSAGAVVGLVPERLPIEVAVPPSRTPEQRTWVRFAREALGVRSPGSTGQPLRSLVEDTVLDLCAAEDNPSTVAHLLTTSCLRQTSPVRLRQGLSRRRRTGNRKLIEEILSEAADGVRSALELRWVRNVERPHQLPAPTRRNQTLVSSRNEPDAAHEDYLTLLELDGLRYHSDEQILRDRRRDNAHSAGGYLTMRYGWPDVLPPQACATARNFAAVLARRGWTGEVGRCPLCENDSSR